MASSESNSFEEPTPTTTNTAIMPLESTPTQQMQNELEMETQKDVVNLNQAENPQRSIL